MLKDATASSINQQALFLCLLFVLFGGCTWEACACRVPFASVSSPRTAATFRLETSGAALFVHAKGVSYAVRNTA